MRKYKTYSPDELTRWIRDMEAHGDIYHHAFYISHAWIHKRSDALTAQHHECQMCKQKGLYVPADMVHHLKTVHDAPWLALTDSNLMALCNECHYTIHHRNIFNSWDDELW